MRITRNGTSIASIERYGHRGNAGRLVVSVLCVLFTWSKGVFIRRAFYRQNIQLTKFRLVS